MCVHVSLLTTVALSCIIANCLLLCTHYLVCAKDASKFIFDFVAADTIIKLEFWNE